MSRTLLSILLVLPAIVHGSTSTFPTAEYARYTLGHLGGPRDVLHDETYLYWISRGRLRIAEKEAVINYEPKPAPAPTKENPKPKPPPFEPMGEVELRHAVTVTKDGKETTALKGVPDRLCFVSPDRICASTGLHLRLIDVKDRRRPKVVSELRVADNEYLGVSKIRAGGPGELWVACRRQGVVRVTVGDGNQMSIVGVLPVDGWASDVVLSGPHAFVATGRGLEVIDISLPAPKTVANLDTERHCEYLAIRGSALFFASKYYVVAVDVAEPSSPKVLSEIGVIDPFFFSGALGLMVRGDYVFCPHAEGGVYVWHFDSDSSRFGLTLQTSYWGRKRRAPDRKQIAEIAKERSSYYRELGLEKKHVKKFVCHKQTSYVISMGLTIDDDDHFYVNDLYGSANVYRCDLEAPWARLVNWVD